MDDLRGDGYTDMHIVLKRKPSPCAVDEVIARPVKDVRVEDNVLSFRSPTQDEVAAIVRGLCVRGEDVVGVHRDDDVLDEIYRRIVGDEV
jgi:hypothetical protein